MTGRHLRRSRGPDPRKVSGALGVLLLGIVLGAGSTAALARAGVDTSASAAELVPVATDRGPRGTATLQPERGPITLAFVGDVNAERSLAQRLSADPAGFVGPFARLLHDADLVVANLEAAIVTGQPGAGPLEGEAKEYVFGAPPAILDALVAGGIDVVSAANNHAIDFGPAGLVQTLDLLRARGDGMVIGIGRDEAAAYAPHVRDVGGHRVAVIAATQVVDADLIARWTAGPDQPGVASAKRVDRLVAEVARAARAADVVVVYLHWGVETEECPSAGQLELARALAEAGADVVVGTHAHRVQGGGSLPSDTARRRTVVHYGLGNFLFGAVSDASARTGVFLVRVDADGVLDHEWVPGRIVGSVPEPLAGPDAADELAVWERQRACTGLAP